MDPKSSNIIILSDDEDDTGSTFSVTKKAQSHSSPDPLKKTASIPKKSDMPGSNQAVEQGGGPASELAVASHEAQKSVVQDTASAAATITTIQNDREQKTAPVAATEGQTRAKSFSGPSSSTEAVELCQRSSSEPCPKKVTKLRLTQPKPPELPKKSPYIRTYLGAPKLVEPPQEPTQGPASFEAPKCNKPAQDLAPAPADFRAPVAYMGPYNNAATAEACYRTQAAKTPTAPDSSSTNPRVLNGGTKAPAAAQSTQERTVSNAPRSNLQPKQSNPGNVTPAKRKPAGDPSSNTKRTRLTNPAPVTKTNSVLWSVPAYEPDKDTTMADEKNTRAISTTRPFMPQLSPFSNSPSTDPSSTAASDSKDYAAKTASSSSAATPTKAGKKPRAMPWTCAQLSDLGNTIRLSVPWEEFAERSNKTVSECLQLYSIVVGMPLMDFQDKALNRAKMAKFSERKKAYSDMEKEARKVHREEARQEKKAEKERAKADCKQKAKGPQQEEGPESVMGYGFGAGMGA